LGKQAFVIAHTLCLRQMSKSESFAAKPEAAAVESAHLRKGIKADTFTSVRRIR
jgi:hypothetical protein